MADFSIIDVHMLQAMTRFGGSNPMEGTLSLKDTDVAKIATNLKNRGNDKLILVDFVPLSNLGTESRYEALRDICNKKRFYSIVREGTVEKQFEAFSLPYFLVNKQLKIIQQPTDIGKQLQVDGYLQLHHKYVEETVYEWVKASISKRPNGSTPWIRLPDGSGANVWFDIKEIIKHPRKALFIAYQMGHSLTQGYYKRPFLQGVHGFIAGNNNSWAVASVMAILFGKELYVIDKFGPLPRINIKWLRETAQKLRGKRLIIVEDVISTGREVDNLYLFLEYSGIQVDRIVCLLDLECGDPLIPEIGIITSLIKPSKRLKYHRIPKFEMLELSNGS